MPIGSRRPLRTRRRASALVAVLASLAVLGAACSDSSDGAGADEGSVSGPVVEHKYGETEVPEDAARVVTVGLIDHEPAIALGTVPVGVEAWFGEEPFGSWPWVVDLWGDEAPQVVGERDDFNFEEIASLDPDLIIGVYSGMTEQDYDTLSKIAPTVAQPIGFDDYGAPWQDMTLQVGRALNKESEAEDLVAETEQLFADVREEHPEFAGQVISVVDPFEGEWGAFSSTDPKVQLMMDIGFVPSAEIDELAGDSNAAEISEERLDVIDVDRLVVLTSEPGVEQQLRANPVFAGLRVVADGRTLFVPYEDPPVGAALSFNSVLSIPYALEQLVPQLAAQTPPTS